jgi:TolA-binding protein
MHPDDHDSQPSGEGQESPHPPRVVVATTDPVIASGRAVDEGRDLEPDQTLVAETSRDTRAVPGYVSRASPFVESKGEHQDHPDDRKDGSARKERPAWMGLVMTAVVALVCGVAGAWAFSHFDSSKDKDQSEQAKGGDDSKGQANKQASGDPEGESPKAMANPDAQAMKDQIQQLYSRFATIQQRVDAMATPRDTNPPELAALRIRVDELSSKADEVASFPGRARSIEDRLDRLQAEVKGLRDQLSAEKAKSTARAPSMSSPDPKVELVAATPPSIDPGSADDAMMAEATALFKKGLYTRADEVFRKLQASRPKDARVWYFSALAHGFATGQWDGETRRFVVQGADRERAGLPPAPRIDSAFAELSPAQGKDWLASYRSQLVKR